MRLSWLSGPRPGRRRRASAVPLRVRRLERRRVLDAALQSLVIAPTAIVDSPPATADTAAEPLVFDWSATEDAREAAAQSAPEGPNPQAEQSDTSPNDTNMSAGSNALEAQLAASAQSIAAAGESRNVRPVVVAAVDQTVNEGRLLDLSAMGGAPPLGLFVDTDLLDTHTATVNWGDGMPTEDATIFFAGGAGALGGSHTYADNGLYTVTVSVTDSSGGSDSKMFNVTVNNVRPVLVVAANQTVNEGQLLNLSGDGAPPLGLFVDPGELDMHVATINWGDGTAAENATIFFADGAGAVGGTHTYADNGVYNVTVKVTDKDGGSDMKSFMVTVNNVRPVLVVAANQTVNEGQLLDLSGDGAPPLGLFVDPGLLDTHTATVNWGDGSATEFATIFFANGAGALGGTHTYADNGVYTVTVKVTDDDGGSDMKMFLVTVVNVPPRVDITGPESVNEGSPGTWTIGPVVDPGNDTVSQYIVRWDNGQTSEFAAAALDKLERTISQIYADGLENHTIAIDVVDEDGVHLNAGTFPITVHNVAPSFVQVNGQPFEGTDISAQGFGIIRVFFTDPGFDNPQNVGNPLNGGEFGEVAETFTLVIRWGDQIVTTVPITDVSPGSRIPITSINQRTGLPIQDAWILESARISGDATTPTRGSIVIEHRFNAANLLSAPTLPLRVTIQATVQDDDAGQVSGSIQVRTPGLGQINPPLVVATDGRGPAEFVPPPPITVALAQPSSLLLSVQSQDRRVSSSSTVSSEMYLELVVISPEGEEVERYRLKDDALLDLRGLFATLPDGHYKIYLVRTDNNSRRPVMEVYVRRGRVIDPSDDSEGTRDRPPTSEATQPHKPVPLEENPLLEPVPNDVEGDPQSGSETVPVDVEVTDNSESPAFSAGSLRWPMAFAGLVLVIGRDGWPKRLEAALSHADERAWQRLRRIGRLGRRIGHASRRTTKSNQTSSSYHSTP